MPTPRLAARPDVIATPHAAGLTVPAIEHQVSLETVAQAADENDGTRPEGGGKRRMLEKRRPMKTV